MLDIIDMNPPSYEVLMPDEKRVKGKHLTWENRHEFKED